MRWLYHVVLAEHWAAATGGERYAPPSLAKEGFVHCSYRDAVAESARLYFPTGASLVVLQIDPRLVAAEVVVAETPRGPMPHVHGAIPRAAIRRALGLAEIAAAPDEL